MPLEGSLVLIARGVEINTYLTPHFPPRTTHSATLHREQEDKRAPYEMCLSFSEDQVGVGWEGVWRQWEEGRE